MLPPPPANAASVNKLPMGTPSPLSVDPTSSSVVTVGANKAGSLRQSTTPYHHHTRTTAVNRSATVSSREVTLQSNTVTTRLTKYPTSISTRANTHAKATATNMASATALGSSLRYAARPATVPSSSIITTASSIAQSAQTPSLHRPVTGLSHYTMPSDTSSISTKKKGGHPLRRGKWTTEEEAYAARLIHEFKSGLLPLTDGTTLRNFLSKLLNCDPMRISKVIQFGRHHPRTVCAHATY